VKSCEAKFFAAAIVRELFTNGAGESADRLVLTSGDGKYLGGWSPRAVNDRVRAILLSQITGPESRSAPCDSSAG